MVYRIRTQFFNPVVLLMAAANLPLTECRGDDRDQLKVGLQTDGRIVVPTNQILQPAGTHVLFPGRPVDLLFLEGGRLLVAKNMRNLVFIESATGTIKQTLTQLPQLGSNPKDLWSCFRRKSFIDGGATGVLAADRDVVPT